VFLEGWNYSALLAPSSMVALSGAVGSIIRYSITVWEVGRASLLRAVRMISSTSASVTIDELAAAEKINSSYVSRLLPDATGTRHRGDNSGRAAAGGDDAAGADGAVSGGVELSYQNEMLRA